MTDTDFAKHAFKPIENLVESSITEYKGTSKPDTPEFVAQKIVAAIYSDLPEIYTHPI
jgi:hypothetical protein